MYKMLVFSLIGVLCWGCVNTGYAELLRLQAAEWAETVTPVFDEQGHKIKTIKRHSLTATLYDRDEFLYDLEDSGNETLIKAVTDSIRRRENWQLLADGKPVEILTIHWVPGNADQVKLEVDWQDDPENLTLDFLHRGAVVVTPPPSNRWNVGEDKTFDFNVHRIVEDDVKYAFDHDIRFHLLRRNWMTPRNGLWLHAISLDGNSIGTIASRDSMRNGSQTAINLVVHPYYFVGGLIYRSEVAVGYQFETRYNPMEDNLLYGVNQSFRFQGVFEIPFTNYPMFKWHQKKGYARLAMPLTVHVGYQPEGEDSEGNSTFARFDFGARYELAFGPYLILQGEYQQTMFQDAPDGVADGQYYAISVAQDLTFFTEVFGAMIPFVDLEKQMEAGKNFIFFRYAEGEKAPAFQDVSEKSIGFGSTF
ncbi:MAG: hypothetical protein D6675_13290 [Gemmatimonadetes bacterium]|nr:MAG: hypothetical protein D6675_13290 [Gemmatimonadota bacterium]